MPYGLIQGRQRSIKSIPAVFTFPQILFPEEATNKAPLEQQPTSSKDKLLNTAPSRMRAPRYDIHLSEECSQYINNPQGEESCVAP